MNRLGEKSLKTLEYYEILDRLATQAASEAAKEKCRALRPLDDHEQAQVWMDQTTDAKNLMIRQGSPGFGGIREVGAILARRHAESARAARRGKPAADRAPRAGLRRGT